MLYEICTKKTDAGVYYVHSIFNQITGEILTLENFVKLTGVIYVSNLNLSFTEIIKCLFKLKYKNVYKCDKCKQFSFAYKSGECLNIKVNHGNNKFLNIVNFEKKFLQEFSTKENNIKLLEYAINNNRNSMSLGNDAFNEFLQLSFKVKGKKMNINACRQVFTRDYPHLNNVLLNEAKEYVSGYQFVKQGFYNEAYEYDITSSYPSQLCNNTPYGDIIKFESIEDVPSTYFFIVKFVVFDVKTKENKINFLNLEEETNILTITLTQHLFELFKNNYYYTFMKIKEVIAFKTRKGKFDEFIKKNIIDGKVNEHDKCIIKYNKAIANSIVGYFGKNFERETSKVIKNKQGYKIEHKLEKCAPVYLPLYLYVLGKSKAEFITRLENLGHGALLYANTDGFITDTPIDLLRLNFGRLDTFGIYKHKRTYTELYINCINGYCGRTDTDDLENTLSGYHTTCKITAQEYEQTKFEYIVNEVNNELSICEYVLS